METHSSILAWETPCTEEPGGLQSMESQRVRHDLETEEQQQATSVSVTGDGVTQTLSSCQTPALPLFP